MVRQERQAPVIEVVKAASVQESHILEQTLREHLRADINPFSHHAARWRVNLKRERVEHDLRKVVIVAVAVDKLLKVVKDLELAEELLDALIAGGEDAQPRDQLADHGLVHTLLGEESFGSRGTNRVNLELRLLVGSITSSSLALTERCTLMIRHGLVPGVGPADLRVTDYARAEFW